MKFEIKDPKWTITNYDNLDLSQTEFDIMYNVTVESNQGITASKDFQRHLIMPPGENMAVMYHDRMVQILRDIMEQEQQKDPSLDIPMDVEDALAMSIMEQMMPGVEFNWYVGQMTRDIVTGGVKSAYWILQAHGPGAPSNGATAEGHVNFNYDQNDPNFVPYEQLTPELVLPWIRETIDRDYRTHHRGNSVQKYYHDLRQAIWQNQQPPDEAVGLPW